MAKEAGRMGSSTLHRLHEMLHEMLREALLGAAIVFSYYALQHGSQAARAAQPPQHPLSAASRHQGCASPGVEPNLHGTSAPLISSGYLSTDGALVIDAHRNPVHIASVAWFGTEGPSGSNLGGLSRPNDIRDMAIILGAIRRDGFNTVRITWSDVNLHYALPEFENVVRIAGHLGLKVIFDHHSDDGAWGQQPNGLWFDTGPGSDGTDGARHSGTVTAQRFEADTVALARAFAGNSTVIGFDLDNEPTMSGSDGHGTEITWGGGGPTDIHQMYETVGNAVEAADPGALIIAEGPQNYAFTFSGRGTAPEGDLTAVKRKPVVLGIPNKVLYSVHEYPDETSGAGAGPDSGSAYVQRMNDAWGYLERQGVAPVWIGEMGSSMKTADAQAWARTIIPYLNGQDRRQDGPAVQTGWDWWAFNGDSVSSPTDGWPGNPVPRVMHYLRQLMPSVCVNPVVTANP